jgi:ankyrin repeat protein
MSEKESKFLLYYSKKNIVDSLKIFVEHDADVNYKNKSGYSPLINSCKQGHEENVKYLIEAGADVNLGTRSINPLFSAVKENNVEIVKILLNHGVDIHRRDRYGKTALLIAVEQGFIEIIRLLTEHGANIFANDKFGNSPISIAEKDGDEIMINILKYTYLFNI